MSYALDQANKLHDAFSKVAAALGEDDSMAAIFVDMGMQMLNTVMNTIMLQIQLKAATLAAIEMGVAMKSASGVIGWIVMAIELIATALASIFQAQEKKRQEQVDAETRRIKKIQHEYENLEKALDNVYDVTRLNALTKAMNDKLYEEIESTKQLIKLEKQAKNPDEDKIADLEREVEALEERMAENLLNKFSTATDGVLDNTLDAARGFVDAWYDAYKEAGDGLEGLNENFNDMFANILKQQASLTLIGPMVDEFKQRVRGYVGSDSILGEYEAKELRALWDEMAPKMNESLKSYFDAFDDILSVDYGELSGLERGIKGMTEDQAEILASYWNSCRFLLSNIDTTLTSIADRVLGGGASSNSTEAAIREQTAVITEIRNMLSSVIGNGGKSTHSMSYLRVNDA
jgi:methyl-accepting chemotaxis protein